MKRFTFRLDRLLRLKRQQLRQADMRLGAARQELLAIEERLQSVQQQLDQAAGRETQSQRRPSLSEMLSRRQWMDELQRRIEGLVAEAARGRDAVAQAAAQRQKAATEAEQLDSYRQRELQEYKSLLEQARQHELNDWIMHRRGASGRESATEAATLHNASAMRRAAAPATPDDCEPPAPRGPRP